jgi:hypothetical protein
MPHNVDLGRYPLDVILPLLERHSARSRDEIADHPALNMEVARIQRCLNPGDNYFVTMARVPNLCIALGHDLLLRWARERYEYLKRTYGLAVDDVQPLTFECALTSFAAVIKEAGDVGKRLNEAGQDGKLDRQDDLRGLERECWDVAEAATQLAAGIAALRRQEQ